jgi:DNA-binding LacI/PurR family transcriptional regulator
MKKNITLADIAKEAGVSKVTVSRVINDRDDVAYDTRIKIQEIIDQVGYKPNALARGLSAKQSFTIGIVTSRLEYYGPRSMFSAIDINADIVGYRLIPYILHEDNPSDIDNHLRNLIALQPDGIILEIPGINDHQLSIKDNQITSSLPIITTEKKLKGIHTVLNIQHVEASAMAVEHLIDQGYRNIGIITGISSWFATKQRLEGWRLALQRNGLPAKQAQIVEGDWTTASGKSGISQLLTQYPDLDAVFVLNDQMALGVLSELNQRHIRIPQEIGVVGFDGIEEAAYFTPSLTTVYQPFDTFGRELVGIIVKMIEENVRKKTYSIPEPIFITPELIVRDSSRRNLD